jgi:hypothetical protein
MLSERRGLLAFLLGSLLRHDSKESNSSQLTLRSVSSAVTDRIEGIPTECHTKDTDETSRS